MVVLLKSIATNTSRLCMACSSYVIPPSSPHSFPLLPPLFSHLSSLSSFLLSS